MDSEGHEHWVLQGDGDDGITLLRLYGQLNSDGKRNLLSAAANSLADQQIRDYQNAGSSQLDACDRLTRLAKDTYPRTDNAAELLAHAVDVEPEWESYVFPDGWLAPVLCPMEDVFGQADRIHWGYMAIREENNADFQMPEPTHFFGVEVPKHKFGEFTTEKGWVFDEAEWRVEVQSQCTQKFASLVEWWRKRFFAALLSGQTQKY